MNKSIEFQADSKLDKEMFEKIKTLALQGHTKSQFRFVYDSLLQLRCTCVSYNELNQICQLKHVRSLYDYHPNLLA